MLSFLLFEARLPAIVAVNFQMAQLTKRICGYIAAELMILIIDKAVQLSNAAIQIIDYVRVLQRLDYLNGLPKIAQLMLAGVRVGGMPYWPTKFRWGYGWSYPRFYGELTAEEIKLVKEKSGKLH